MVASKTFKQVQFFAITDHVFIPVSFSSDINKFYFLIDWVNVANDLLRSCHINQHIKHLSECGADVFVHLYESILREKVPGGNNNQSFLTLLFFLPFFFPFIFYKFKFAKPCRR